MDRRNFIKTLMASGVLGASPMAAQAAGQLFSAATEPVTIVAQSGLPQAAELVARLGQVFAAAGIEHRHVAASAGELAEYAHLAALLDRVAGSRIVGVMDDAAAVIFQELAATRGAACALSTHHRFTGREVRQCCTSAGLDSSVAWSDALPAHAERISRLYADTLGGQAPAVGREATPGTVGAASRAPASLVSFLITT